MTIPIATDLKGTLRVNAQIERGIALPGSEYRGNLARMDPVCDRRGRQYVISTPYDEVAFHDLIQYTTEGFASAGDQIAMAPATHVASFGYNVHPSQLLFIQFWNQSNQFDPNPELEAVFPVQGNYGVFSFDTKLSFSRGLYIAISTQPDSISPATPAECLVFTCVARAAG